MAKSDSPYSTGFVSGKVDFDLDPKGQMKKYKQEEKDTHYAPYTLPYEFSALPEYFANMVDNGLQICKTIESLLGAKDIDHKEDLLKLKDNVDKMVVYLLKNVDSTLDKFTIGANVESDVEQD